MKQTNYVNVKKKEFVFSKKFVLLTINFQRLRNGELKQRLLKWNHTVECYYIGISTAAKSTNLKEKKSGNILLNLF